MAPKKSKSSSTPKRRKLTFKELEWDYLPMIVLFSIMGGILALLLILLSVYQDSRASEEFYKLKKFRMFDTFLNKMEEREEPEPTVDVQLDEIEEAEF